MELHPTSSVSLQNSNWSAAGSAGPAGLRWPLWDERNSVPGGVPSSDRLPQVYPQGEGRGVGGGAKGKCGGMPGSQSIASEMACQHLFLILLAKARLTCTDSRLQNKTHLSRSGYADDICKGKNAGRVKM